MYTFCCEYISFREVRPDYYNTTIYYTISLGGGGVVDRDPQFVLRNISTVPNILIDNSV